MKKYIIAGTLFAGSCAMLAQDGSNDPTFNPSDVGFGSGDGAQNLVYAVAQLPDGKLLIGGIFFSYDAVFHYRLARLNPDGRIDTTFHPGSGPSYDVFAIDVQPDGKPVIAGFFPSYDGVARGRIARLETDGALDLTFDPGAGTNVAIRALAIQPDGKILIGGDFSTYDGTGRNRIARVNADGSLDTSFDPGLGADGAVRSLSLQPDGAVIIAGEFTTFNGTPCGHVARLNPDGSLDATFATGAGADDRINSICLRPDGRIVIAGNFTSYDGVGRMRVAGLNADGSLDTAFDPGSGADAEVFSTSLRTTGEIILGGAFINCNGTARSRLAQLLPDGGLDLGWDPGSGADSTIFATVVQPDDGVVCAGAFRRLDGKYRRYVARMSPDGTQDLGFDPPSGVNGTYIWHTAEQPDGKLVVGGSFETYNGVYRKNIARLHQDGSLDESFDPGSGTWGSVLGVELLVDGRILIAGDFTEVDGVPRNRIARLYSDGSLDISFDPGAGANDLVYGMAVQPDGRIIVFGHFTTIDGMARVRVARLFADGALDTSFDPGAGANDRLSDVLLQPDGRMLICGQLTTFDGTSRKCIARLNENGSLDTSFDPGSGLNNGVDLSACHSMALQPDGKVIIGGWFSSYNGVSRNNIARVNASGALDNTFNVGTGLNSTVTLHSIIRLSSGQIIVAGAFTTYNGTPKNMAVRVNPDGSMDPDFDCGAGLNHGLQTVELLADGSLIIGGRFTSFDGTGRNRIARILNDLTTNTSESDGPELALFPNPSDGRFSITTPLIGPLEVTVADITGKVIHKEHVQVVASGLNTIDLSAHGPGAYVISIVGPSGRTTERLIVQ